MNEHDPQHEHADLERLIARQPLRRPGRSLDDRMHRLFQQRDAVADEAASSLRFMPAWRTFAFAAAMTAIVIGVTFAVIRLSPTYERVIVTQGNEPEEGIHPLPAFHPVRYEETWSDLQPEGVIVVDGDPLRRYQHRTYEHVQLIDEKNNIRIEYTRPRQETIVLPVKYD